MDFMRVLDQTVREIKREVNLKVLKVPEIEQKVLDATSDEPWGPHGSALSEIAQTTKKFTECQMIMNVLWTRLTETGANWRHVYKALAVIEYLVANGSERALDDILERSHRIASISDFQYVEPSGKDVGVNVRKKVETILALLSDKGKIQEVRNKAAANRDKYFGLSSTGVTYKSSSASHGGSSFQHNDRYGSLSGGKEDGSFKDSYSDREQYGGEIEQKHGKRENHNKSQETFAKEDEENRSKKGLRHHARNQDSSPTSSLKPLPKPSSAPSMNSDAQPNRSEDDFDDFDPRGSSTAGSANASFKQVDLFSQNLVGDLMDAPPPISMETTTSNNVKVPEVDLFADATFISASPHVETSSQTQGDIDLFANQPANPVAFSANTDFFAAPDQGLPPETKSLISEPTNTKVSDPFAAFPLNNFEESDLFGSFTSHANPNTESSQNSMANINNSDQTSSTTSKPAAKDTFQVKSGIWADSLSRGLIDLNITAPKKTSLADIGIVGGLGDGLDEKEKGPSTSMYMGRAMGSGSGLGMSGFPSSTAMGGNGGFSTLGQQQFGRSK